MSIRKSHSKSRRGCLACKRRHVKCDEQGPPCAGCIVRQTPCSYAELPASSTTPPSAFASGLRSAPGPLPPPDDPRRLLELELMHRWSSSTYETLCGLPEEHYLMQVIVPRGAFRVPGGAAYLLDGLLCVAALDLAVEAQRKLKPKTDGDSEGKVEVGEMEMGGDADGEKAWRKELEVLEERHVRRDVKVYIRAALEYYARSLGAYTTALAGQITAENYLPVFIYSLLVALISVVLPECEAALEAEAGPEGDGSGALETGFAEPKTMRESIVSLFELMNGNASVAIASWEFLKDGPFRYDFWDLVPPLELLDKDTKEAMARLRKLNDSTHPQQTSGLSPLTTGCTSTPSTKTTEASSASPTPPSRHASYTSSINELEGVFARDISNKVKGVCIVWPGLVGRSFTAAARRAEPMALVILMHWGVLLARLGRSTWWAARAGPNLVAELSEGLFRSQLSPAPELREAIVWARAQAGLPPLY